MLNVSHDYPFTCQTHDDILDELCRHENQTCSPSLYAAGKLSLGTNSEKMECLEGILGAQCEVTQVTKAYPLMELLLLECAIQVLKRYYVHQVFIHHTSQRFQHVSQLDLVWDSYEVDSKSLEATTRAKSGKVVHRHVVGSTHIPSKWQSFLCMDLNKIKLFSSYSKALGCFCASATGCTLILTPCSPKEADMRMMPPMYSTCYTTWSSPNISAAVDTDIPYVSGFEKRSHFIETLIWSESIGNQLSFNACFMFIAVWIHFYVH